MVHDDDILFTASTTSLTELSNVLACIAAVGTKCLVIINDVGIFFVANEMNICRAQANLDAKFFDSFTFVSDETQASSVTDVRLVIDLQSFLESVTIANTSSGAGLRAPDSMAVDQQQQQQQKPQKTNCILSYKSYGEPFVLSFEDELMLERVELKTYNLDAMDQDDAEDDEMFQIDNTKIVFEMILQSSIVYQILKDLKEIQTDQIFVYGDTRDAGKSAPKLVFISKSGLGFSKMQYPRKKRLLEELKVYKMVPKNGADSQQRSQHFNDTYSLPQDDDRFEYVETNQDSVTCFYNFTYFVKMMRATRLASKMKFKKDSNGLTSVILLIDQNHASVEFKLLEQINDYVDGDVDDDTTMNHNYNNSFVQNLIDDDDVVELPVAMAEEQQKIDEFFNRGDEQRNDIDVIGARIVDNPLFL